MSKPSLVVSDFTDKFNETIKRFKRDAVLIGIPETDEARDDDAPINNATILAINHFGSPANNIPPRPVMSIGIKNAQDAVYEQFKLCAREALSTGPIALEKYYNRIGIIASNSVKRVITTQDGIEGPAESTLKARKYITKSGFKGLKSLLVTGQMRNSITYVVQNIWGA